MRLKGIPLPAPFPALALLAFILLAAFGCASTPGGPGDAPGQPEHDGEWGIYRLDRVSENVKLIFSTDDSIHRIDLSSDGSTLVFQQNFGSDIFTDSEICVVGTDGGGYQRLTTNGWLDAYPCWSPDDDEILFLSWPDRPANDMDIYIMDAPASGRARPDPTLLYDSGFHDGDCAWEDTSIVFTRESQIWIMNEEGGNARQVTDYALAGVQGNADLPFGDYDPRLRPGGDLICFDRMVDDHYPSGNYDFFTITPAGTGESQITSTAYGQFIAEWSRDGSELVFTVAAIDGQGKFDIYTMNSNGSDYTNITPDHWPADFLCIHPNFSEDASSIYFVGQWYEP
jgi:Tol biopolymer transport system component